MSPDQSDEPTIVDVLTGKRGHKALVNITSAQRIYYNYRLDPHSFAAEITTAGSTMEARDFRSRRQRRDEDGWIGNGLIVYT